MTRSIDAARPVRSGPPTTATGASVAMTPPLQVRPDGDAEMPGLWFGGGGKCRPVEAVDAHDGEMHVAMRPSTDAFGGLAVADHHGDVVVIGSAGVAIKLSPTTTPAVTRRWP
jgi:hypothetical protein